MENQGELNSKIPVRGQDWLRFFARDPLTVAALASIVIEIVGLWMLISWDVEGAEDEVGDVPLELWGAVLAIPFSVFCIWVVRLTWIRSHVAAAAIARARGGNAWAVQWAETTLRRLRWLGAPASKYGCLVMGEHEISVWRARFGSAEQLLSIPRSQLLTVEKADSPFDTGRGHEPLPGVALTLEGDPQRLHFIGAVMLPMGQTAFQAQFIDAEATIRHP